MPRYVLRWPCFALLHPSSCCCCCRVLLSHLFFFLQSRRGTPVPACPPVGPLFLCLLVSACLFSAWYCCCTRRVAGHVRLLSHDLVWERLNGGFAKSLLALSPCLCGLPCLSLPAARIVPSLGNAAEARRAVPTLMKLAEPSRCFPPSFFYFCMPLSLTVLACLCASVSLLGTAATVLDVQ